MRGVEERGDVHEAGADWDRGPSYDECPDDADDYPQPDYGGQPRLYLADGKPVRRIVGKCVYAAALGDGHDSIGYPVCPNPQCSSVGGRRCQRGGGAPVQLHRFLLLFISVALAGSAVAVAGAIGFIGLIAPHIARKTCRAIPWRMHSGCGSGWRPDASRCRHDCQNGLSSARHSCGGLYRGGGGAFLSLYAFEKSQSIGASITDSGIPFK